MTNLHVARGLSNLAISALVVASMSAAAAFAAPPPTRIDAYLGLWEGVDALDGSVVRLSLSDVNDDGTIELTQTESFYSVCHSMSANFSLGRGVELGTATVAQKRDALKIELQLVCIDDDNAKHEQEPFAVEYRLRSRGRALVVPAFTDSLPIVLHRVAQ